MRNAKIVCTLGPASDDVETIEGLVDAGMSVARLNASHGSTEHRAELIDRLRQVDATSGETLAVMHDLQGPEVRTAPLEEPIELVDGSTVRFVEGDTATPEEIGLSTSIAAVSPGDRVLIADGRIETTVTDVEGETVHARVDSGGMLGGRKGVNVPRVDLGLETITEADRRELELAAEKGVDFVAASFVRSGEDVYGVSQTLEELGASIPVIAKIERADAVENLDEIIDEAYGVMVARGDLGVECPLERVPLIQKRIIRKCVNAGVPVITATEMLDSMIRERRPTRAEAADVANAVLDGTDAVMLSGETAVGEDPVNVVETMDRIVRDVESSEEYTEVFEGMVPASGETQTDALARSARYMARDIGASAVVAATESGYTALKAAKYRPTIPIVASTPNDGVRRRLGLSWGVVPKYTPMTSGGAESVIQEAVQTALEAGAAESGDTVVALAGMMTEMEGVDTTNMLKVHVAAEILASGRSVVEGSATGPLFRLDYGDLTGLPEGAIVALEEGFEGEFSGEPRKLAGIIDARPGQTSYAAIVARELGVPMISGADLPGEDELPDESPVTLDAERGVLYEDSVRTGHPDPGRPSHE
ncbi:pyruvate kinase [Salinirubellus sp. GCM10025818]|uniref:pyruvate kinase n=1 Tax=Salinirubellus TaxID=2162630 RepID=UPI0030D3634D